MGWSFTNFLESVGDFGQSTVETVGGAVGPVAEGVGNFVSGAGYWANTLNPIAGAINLAESVSGQDFDIEMASQQKEAYKDIYNFGKYVSENPGRASALAGQGIINGATSITGFVGDVVWNGGTYIATTLPANTYIAIHNAGLDEGEVKAEYAKNPLHLGKQDSMFGLTDTLVEAGQIKNIAFGVGAVADGMRDAANKTTNFVTTTALNYEENPLHLGPQNRLALAQGAKAFIEDIPAFGDIQAMIEVKDGNGNTITVENPNAGYERGLQYGPQIATETVAFMFVTGGLGAAWGLVRGGGKTAQVAINQTDDVIRGTQTIASETAIQLSDDAPKVIAEGLKAGADDTVKATGETAKNTTSGISSGADETAKAGVETGIQLSDDTVKAASETTKNSANSSASSITDGTLNASAETTSQVAPLTFLESRIASAKEGYQKGHDFGNFMRNGPKGKAFEVFAVGGGFYMSTSAEKSAAEALIKQTGEAPSAYGVSKAEESSKKITEDYNWALEELKEKYGAPPSPSKLNDNKTNDTPENDKHSALSPVDMGDFNTASVKQSGSVNHFAFESGGDTAMGFNGAATGSKMALDGVLDKTLLPHLYANTPEVAPPTQRA